MDREELVELLRNNYFNPLRIDFPLKLIREYCIEKQLEEEKINMVINHVLSLNLLQITSKIASEYFERKFNICKLWNKPVNNLRDLLQIF